ncbi:MAG: ParA family protein, partial [Flammeovirgaceae bacterium]|nr:ParA family protein [Flammeovirgaceae bacterium]
MMLTNDTVIKFLKKNQVFSLTELEKESGLPNGLLSKVLRGDRKLNNNHLKNIKPVLKKYGFEDKVGQKAAKVICIVNHKGGVGKT